VPVRATAYIPFDELDAAGAVRLRSRGTFVVRTTGADSLAMAPALRAAVIRTRPEFHVDSIRTQEEIDGANMLRERLLAMLGSFFAVVALALAGVGLYGVLDYSVLQRRREIGIRMAIGARSGDVARSVTVSAFSVVAGGAAIGVAIGEASTRYVESLLFGVKVSDPRMLTIPAVSLVAVAALAAMRPVLRAVRIDPASILRSE
jgi:ABC-type antimicrobial peptide transport system permease subunit